MNNDTQDQNKPKYDLSFIKNFIDANPHALKELGISPAGRKKGSKNNSTVEAGKVIEIPKELMPPPEDVIEVSRKVAKQLVEKIKKPRQYKDEETKTRMLTILAEGREKAKLVKEQKKLEREKQAVEQHKSSVQKIKVKEPKKVVKKAVVQPEEPESEEDDVEIIRAKKKVEKKKEILKEIEEELNRLPAPNKPASLYQGQLRGW
jgi:hypothetical protein